MWKDLADCNHRKKMLKKGNTPSNPETFPIL